MKLLIPFLSLLFLCVTTSAAVSSTPTRALIYNGTGACHEGCAEASAEMAKRVGLIPIFVGDREIDSQSTEEERTELFKGAAVWIQPGGYSSTVVTTIAPELKSALTNFVKKGGAYIGFCAGAFASTRYSGDTDYLGFHLFSGITSLFWNGGHLVDMIPVLWRGKIRDVYFEGGPYLYDLEPSSEIIATYPNGQIAAAREEYGNGRVFITGFHPEAPQFWRDFYGLNDTDGLDYDLVDEMLNWVTHSRE